jgi:hypothetical protein
MVSSLHVTCGKPASAFHKNHWGVTKPFSSTGVAPSVEAFDKLINSMVAEFLKNSRVLAGDVETHVSASCPSGNPNGFMMLFISPFIYTCIYLSFKCLLIKASEGTRNSEMSETREFCPTPASEFYLYLYFGEIKDIHNYITNCSIIGTTKK